MLTDAHCHLQDKKFAHDLDAVVDNARAAGVETLVTVGYDMPSSRYGIQLAERYSSVYATVGVHPHDARTVTGADLDELARIGQHPRVVAVGEIGLDFFRNLSPRKDQERAFRAQLDVACDLSLPVVIHSRDADEEVFAILDEYAAQVRPSWPAGRPLGVMHCYAGNLELARRYLEIGFMVSIAATVTYPAAERTRQVATHVPLDHLTIETDAPYLPPQVIRGQRNEPARVRDVAEYIARLRGVTCEEFAVATAGNAARLFALPA